MAKHFRDRAVAGFAFASPLLANERTVSFKQPSSQLRCPVGRRAQPNALVEALRRHHNATPARLCYRPSAPETVTPAVALDGPRECSAAQSGSPPQGSLARLGVVSHP